MYEYPPEAVIEHANGNSLRVAAYPLEVDYVRVCNTVGEEIAYWSIDEIKEDPADVVGAIVGAVLGG